MGRLLDGFPSWSQLTDPDPRTGRVDSASSSDCGEEAVSIWIAGKTGKYTDEADLRRSLGKSDSDGRTTPEDLVELLRQNHITAKRNSWSDSLYKERLRAEIDRGEPVAVLGYWLDTQVLHWVLAIGYGNGYMLAMDPWTGHLTTYKWMSVYSLATGDVVTAT